MINASDFRNGVTIELDDGNVYSVVEFLHVKPGKGSAFVRTKIKNVMTGGVVERTFNPTDKVQRAIIETKELEYLYNDGAFYYLMDNETFEQLPLEEEQMHDALPYITENMTVTVRFFKGKAFSVAAPNFVELTITECEPGVRGDTATNATKVAKLETGYEVNVPLFINEGEKIQIDTRTGEYMGRA